MIKKSFILIILNFSLAFASCNRVEPAGFWKSYRADLLEMNISDQGPYGGHRAIYWKSVKPNTFISTHFLGFAKKNGWKLVDSSAYNSNQTNKWAYNNKPVFPLSSKGFSDTIENNTQLENFPRWFGGQLTVFSFKTGWVTIQSGTDNSIKENGFIIINSDRTQMAVCHLWGE